MCALEVQSGYAQVAFVIALVNPVVVGFGRRSAKPTCVLGNRPPMQSACQKALLRGLGVEN